MYKSKLHIILVIKFLCLFCHCKIGAEPFPVIKTDDSTITEKCAFEELAKSIVLLLDNDFERAIGEFDLIKNHLLDNTADCNKFYYCLINGRIYHYKGIAKIAYSFYTKAYTLTKHLSFASKRKKLIYFDLLEFSIQEGDWSMCTKLFNEMCQYLSDHEDLELLLEYYVYNLYYSYKRLDITSCKQYLSFIEASFETESISIEIRTKGLLYALYIYCYINDEVLYYDCKRKLKIILPQLENKRLKAWIYKSVATHESYRNDYKSAQTTINIASDIISQSRQPIIMQYVKADHASILQNDKKWSEIFKLSKDAYHLSKAQTCKFSNRAKQLSSILYLESCVETKKDFTIDLAKDIYKSGINKDETFDFYFNSILCRYYIDKKKYDTAYIYFNKAIKHRIGKDINWALTNIATYNILTPAYEFNPLGWYVFSMPEYMFSIHANTNMVYIKELIKSCFKTGQDFPPLIFAAKNLLDEEIKFSQYFNDADKIEVNSELLSLYYKSINQPIMAKKYKEEAIVYSNFVAKKASCCIKSQGNSTHNNLSPSKLNTQNKYSWYSIILWIYGMALLFICLVGLTFYTKNRKTKYWEIKKKKSMLAKIIKIQSDNKELISYRVDTKIAQLLHDVGENKEYKLNELEEKLTFWMLQELDYNQKGILGELLDVLWIENSNNTSIGKLTYQMNMLANRLLLPKSIKYKFYSDITQSDFLIFSHNYKYIYLTFKEIVNIHTQSLEVTKMEFSINIQDSIFKLNINIIGNTSKAGDINQLKIKNILEKEGGRTFEISMKTNQNVARSYIAEFQL